MSNEVATQKKEITVSKTGGLNLDTFEDVWRFSKVLASSGMAPKGLDSPEAICIAVEMGLEIGLKPMAAVQNIAVINGRPSLWGDAVLAVCRGSGKFDESVFAETIEGTGENMVAVCKVRRLPSGRTQEHRFSVADAKKASLWGKSGPWTQYPQRMLKLRARGFALRDTFGDFLRGVGIAEEEYDRPEQSENVIVVEQQESQSATVAEKAKAKRKKSSKKTEPKAEKPAAPEPETETVDAEPKADPLGGPTPYEQMRDFIESTTREADMDSLRKQCEGMKNSGKLSQDEFDKLTQQSNQKLEAIGA